MSAPSSGSACYAAAISTFFAAGLRTQRQRVPHNTDGLEASLVELFGVHGTEAVVALGAKALPPDLRTPAFAIAVDLVLADGEASIEERKFIDGLQELLQIPDEDAVKIVDVIIIKNSV